MKSLASIWAEGRPVINGWLSIGNAFNAEILAHQGYDALTVDIQHGILGFSDAVPMLQAISGRGPVPIVRVPWRDPAEIMKALDAGAMAIICPMINSAEEAAELVSFCRYPPHGTRSYGPTRTIIANGAGYYAAANTEIVVLAMIETKEGVDNLDEILATPGLDGVYIGPSDLSIGVTDGSLPPGMDRTEEDMVALIKDICARSHAAGKKAGLHCGAPAYAAQAIGWGFDMITLTNDVNLLAKSAAAQVSETRKLLES